MNRRAFLKTSATVAGGFVVAFYIPSGMKKAFAQGAAPAALMKPNAFIAIASDNSITITINKLEMGQGVNTSMAQLIAEELECDWTKIRSVSAPVAPVYNHSVFGMQMTGGSTALASTWDQYRMIGASMREMLKAAAAAKWEVPLSEVKAQDGFIVHAKMGKLSYGELAEAANSLPMPATTPNATKLKDPKDFKIIGQSMKRVDAKEKSNGTAIFGLDVKIPGMLYAAVARPPLPGATLGAVNEAAAKAVVGVVEIVRFADRIAVLAKSTFAAIKGRDALQASWKMGELEKVSTDSLMADFKLKSKSKGLVANNRGDVEASLASAPKKLEMEYEFPFLAHAAMEPLNCTISFDGKKAELWSAHQMPTIDLGVAAQILEIKPENVVLHTTYAGGSFGRRASKTSDYIVEAAQLAKKVKKPLQVVWTRADDTRGGYFRPMNVHRVQMGFDDQKRLVGWDHHIVGQSVIAGSAFESMMVKEGLEATVTEGVSDTHYDLKNFRCQQTRVPTPVTTLWWRSVGHTHTAYAMETAMDELAEQTNKDPMKLRRELLAKSPRHVAVLDLLQKKTGWGKKKAPKGRAWGLAIHESFNSVVGHVVEVSIDDGRAKVHKVWSAVHCGQVVNPEGARTQIEGAIVYGLSAAFYQEIKIEKGNIVTANFDSYPVMRLNEMPKVEVYFVETTDQPTGLGEPGLPPIAPAVANAVYRLTKKRIRKLPFPSDLSSDLNADAKA